MKNFYIKLETTIELETFIFLLERRDRLKKEVKKSMLWNFGTYKDNVYFLQMDEKGFYSSLASSKFDKKNLLTFHNFFSKYNKQ